MEEDRKVTKKKLTHKKFSAMLERIADNGHPIENWYPTMEDAEDIAKDPVENYEFILWIVESNPDRELTEEEKEVETYLQKILSEYTEFI